MIIVDDDGVMHEVIKVPREATNGDIIKEMYPDARIIDQGSVIYILNDNDPANYISCRFPRSFWDKRYNSI